MRVVRELVRGGRGREGGGVGWVDGDGETMLHLACKIEVRVKREKREREIKKRQKRERKKAERGGTLTPLFLFLLP